MRYFFCLRIHAPHARDVLAQSYVILPREVKRVRVQRIREVYPRCIAARTEAICLDMSSELVRAKESGRTSFSPARHFLLYFILKNLFYLIYKWKLD